MKLSDLFETVSHAIIFESSNEPLVLQATQRFRRNFRRNWQLNQRVVGEFKQFIEHKQASSNTPFGIKDTAFIDPGHRGLKGWWHAHLHFGKAIVIYKPVGNRLILADITDHKSVEGEGNAIQRLGEYLQAVDQGLAGANTNANSTVTNLTDTDTDLVDMGVKKPQEPGAPKVDLKELESFIYTAATNDQDRQLMIAYRNGENDEFREFLEIVPGAVTLPRDQVNTIINRALKYIADQKFT